MPRLIPFHVEHLMRLANRDGWHGATAKLAAEQATGGPAFTAVEGNRMLGAAGVLVPWPGVGMAWMVLAADIAPYGLWLTRTVRRVLDDVTRAYRLHRVEALALVESERNQRWLEVLGFGRERDGVAQAYTADRRAMVRYERVRGSDG